MPDTEEVLDPVEEVEELPEEVDGGDPPQEEQETLSDAEQKEAKNLYKLLKDKSQQKNVIRVLAQQAGLLDAETKAEVKEAKKDLKALVKEKLGPEYAFLSDKLGDMMEAVLQEERKTVTEHLTKVQSNEVERETSTALERLSRETKGESAKFEDRMIQLMDRIKPSDNLSVYEYLKDLYTLASAGKSTARASAQIADKIRRNSGNAAERLQSRGAAGAAGNKVTPGPEKKGAREAVKFAMKQLGMDQD